MELPNKDKLIELLDESLKQHIDLYKEAPDSRAPLDVFTSLHNGIAKVWIKGDLKKQILKCKTYEELVIKCKFSAILDKRLNPPKHMRDTMLAWRKGFIDHYLGMVRDETK